MNSCNDDTKSIEIFDFDGEPIRVILDERGEPLFDASALSAVLGFGDATHATRGLDDDEKTLHLVEGKRGEREMTFVTEAGMYSMVLRSRKPEAKRFKRWVTHEVLPQIRKTGGYSIHKDPEAEARRLLEDPELVLKIALEQTKARKIAEAERDEALKAKALVEAEVAELQPKAELAEEFLSTGGAMPLRDAALTLVEKHGIDIGQNRLMKALRRFGMVDGGDTPYAKHRKHLHLVPTGYVDRWGIRKTKVVVTTLGIEYIRRRLLHEMGLDSKGRPLQTDEDPEIPALVAPDDRPLRVVSGDDAE